MHLQVNSTLPLLEKICVDASHRLPTKPNKSPPPVLTSFTSRLTKDDWLSKKEQLKVAVVYLDGKPHYTEQKASVADEIQSSRKGY